MNLLIKFPDKSQSFCNGVEFGRILEKMERGDEHVTNNGFPMREDNIEVVKQAARQYGYLATFSEPYLEGWVNLFIIKKITTEN